MKLFGNRKHERSRQAAQTAGEAPAAGQPAEAGQDLSATAILDQVRLEQALAQAGTAQSGAKQAKTETARTEKAQASQKSKGWWGRRTGLQKGLLILAACLLVLGGTVLAVWKAVVKPPEGTTIDAASAGSIIDAIEGTEEGPAVIDAGGEPGEEAAVYTLAEDTEPEEPQEDPEKEEEEEYVPTQRLEGTYNVLLCGTDGDDGRTDTIMLASFDVTDHQLNILSIPRDTMYLSGSKVAKINSAYGTGGRGVEGIEYLAAKLTTMLGVPIDAYVLVDLQAFVEVVDLIGGVWFDVPQDMNYEDPYQDLYIHLTAGYQHLDGEKCMQLVRFRSYPQADIQRVSVQQDFLKAVMDQCLSIGNITKVREFANIISENMTTNLTLGSMVDLGVELLSVDLDTVRFCTLPGEGYTYSDGGAYYVLYRNQTVTMLNEYFNPYDRDLTTADVSMVYKSGGSIVMPSGRTYTAGSGSSNSTLTTQTPTVVPAASSEPEETEAEADQSGTEVSQDETSAGTEASEGETDSPEGTSSEEAGEAREDNADLDVPQEGGESPAQEGETVSETGTEAADPGESAPEPAASDDSSSEPGTGAETAGQEPASGTETPGGEARGTVDFE